MNHMNYLKIVILSVFLINAGGNIFAMEVANHAEPRSPKKTGKDATNQVRRARIAQKRSKDATSQARRAGSPKKAVRTQQAEHEPGSPKKPVRTQQATRPVKGNGKRLFADVEAEEDKVVKPLQSEEDEIAASPQSEENKIAEPSSPKRRRVAKPMTLSPVKPLKDGGAGLAIRNYAIYALVAYEESTKDLSYVPEQKERIDFSKVLDTDEVTNVVIDESNLNLALRAVEDRIDQWIEKNPLLFYRVVYVGLAESITDRSGGHRSDLKEISDNSNKSRWNGSQKVRFCDQLSDYGFSVHMTGLVYNIPKEFLTVLEVLVGEKFRVLQKGTSVLGNHAAWARVADYQEWKVQRSLKDYPIVEKFHRELFRFLVAIQ